MDTLVAPIRQVSHAIKTVPDSLSGGVQKIFTKVNFCQLAVLKMILTYMEFHILELRNGHEMKES